MMNRPPRPNSAAARDAGAEAPWHPPLLRPRTAAARLANAPASVETHLARRSGGTSPDRAAAVGTGVDDDELRAAARRYLPNHFVSTNFGPVSSRPQSSHGGGRYTPDDSLAYAKELEQVYLGRRPGSAGGSQSRPGTSAGLPNAAPRHTSSLSSQPHATSTTNLLKLDGAALSPEAAPLGSATRPSSASTVVRSALLGQGWSDERLVAVLDEQLRGAVELSDLRRKLTAQLDVVDTCSTPDERFAAYRKGLTAACSAQPTLTALLSEVFREVDKLLRYYTVSKATGEVEVATTAMRSSMAEAAAATQVASARQQRVDDLEAVVDRLTQASVEASRQQADLEAFIAEMRAAVSSVHSAVIMPDQPVPSRHTSITPSAVTPAVRTPTVAALPNFALPPMMLPGAAPAVPLYPDKESTRGFVDAVFRLGHEIEGLRAENLRLAEVASNAVDQHTQQAREMVELLDRANGFQTHVGHMKSTMRVMKTYIEKLEQRVMLLSEPTDRATTADLDRIRAEAHAAAGDAALNNVAEPLLWATLNFRGTVEHDAAHHSFNAQDLKADLPPADLQSIVKTVQARFIGPEDSVPAHLRQLAIPRLSARPFDGIDQVNAFITEVNTTYTALLQTQPYGQQRLYDEHLWETCLRKAPAQSVKAASETSLTLYHVALRYDRRSPLTCYVFNRVAARELPGDLLVHLPRHMAALLERLRKLEPTAKRAKDKVTRAAFTAAVAECWPNAAPAELHCIAAATVTAGAMDSAKFTDEVAYEAYFERATPGAQLVYETLVHVLVSCGVRFVEDVKQRCAAAVREEVRKMQVSVKHERLASVGAEVRRMMKLDDFEVVRDPGLVTLQAVLLALQRADPLIRPGDQRRILATAAADKLFFEADPESPAYFDRLEATQLHLDEVGRRWRRGCFMLPTTPHSAGDVPAPPGAPDGISSDARAASP
jgi:hypothetical protein